MSNPTQKILTIITLCAITALFASLPALAVVVHRRSNMQDPSSGFWVANELPGRVVINEIMADPTPLVGLPDFEWIELFNAGNSTINLAGWRIVVGTTSRTLPDAWLDPGEFVIVCNAAASEALMQWGRRAVISLPALRNTGNRIALYTIEGDVADVVNYSDKWYSDNKKKEGGWALERIDPFRNCGEAANWTASRDEKGGTPGAVNSVFARNNDSTPPEIIWAGATSVNTAEIYFSEPMDTLLLRQSDNYSLAGLPGEPGETVVRGENSVILRWNLPLQINKTFTLNLRNLTDACGNQLQEKSVRIQWVELEPGDVVVNEILFNPLQGGVDFVELHNRSQKRIDAGKLTLAGRDKNLVLRQHVSLKTLNKIIEPGEYLAVTTNREILLTFYTSRCPECIYNLPSLPSYNNDEGWVALIDDAQSVMDEFHYTGEMHHQLLHNVKGVSLERVNPDAATSFPENWQSASSDVGYATPGYQNSQFQNELPRRAGFFVEPKAFSPNGDGFNDELLLHYETSSPGWVANAWIFDTSGRMKMQLLKNQLMAVSGTIPWNGDDNTGSRIPYGPYVLFIEMYDLKGNLERFRKAIFMIDY